MARNYTPVAADSAASSTNADVVVTLAAVAGKRHVISAVRGSYSAAATGTLEIAFGASKVFQQDIVAAGPFERDFKDRPLLAPVNTAVTVTLKAGGSGVVGKLSVDRSGTS